MGFKAPSQLPAAFIFNRKGIRASVLGGFARSRFASTIQITLKITAKSWYASFSAIMRLTRFVSLPRMGKRGDGHFPIIFNGHFPIIFTSRTLQ